MIVSWESSFSSSKEVARKKATSTRWEKIRVRVKINGGKKTTKNPSQNQTKQINENPNSWRPLALSGQLLIAALDLREASRAASNYWVLQSLALAVIRLCLGDNVKHEEVLTAASPRPLQFKTKPDLTTMKENKTGPFHEAPSNWQDG